MSTVADERQIAQALRVALPQGDAELIERLAALLAQYAAGAAAEAAPAEREALLPLLERLSGRSVVGSGVRIDFSASQLGDVAIGDVAGGDLVKIQLVVPAAPVSDPTDVGGLADPYQGLAAFRFADQQRYAGRGRAAAQAVQALVEPGAERVALLITGASGSGKSSFAQAGVAPALQRFYAERHQELRFAVVRPGRYPVAQLGDALRQLGVAPETQDEPGAMLVQLAQQTSAAQVNLIVIDQLEELFTLALPEQRAALVALLGSLAPFAALRTHLLLTLRSDFLAELFQLPELFSLAKVGVELRTMTPDELRLAITRPLEQHAGKAFEPALLDRLVAEGGAEATYLPLVQVALQRLWRGGSLRLAHYRDLAAALSETADEALAASTAGTPRPPAEQDQLLAICADLVEVSLDANTRRDVRRPRRLSELTGGDAGRRSLVEELVAARLLSIRRETVEGAQAELVELIHETLLVNWPRLGDAIDERRTALQQRARFELGLREWLQQQKAPAYLLSGVRLAEAGELAGRDDLALRSAEARELLRESEAAVRREREAQEQRERELAVERRLRAELAYLRYLAGGALTIGAGYGLAFALLVALRATSLGTTLVALLFTLTLGLLVGAVVAAGLYVARARAAIWPPLLGGAVAGSASFAIFVWGPLDGALSLATLLAGALIGLAVGGGALLAVRTRQPAWSLGLGVAAFLLMGLLLGQAEGWQELAALIPPGAVLGAGAAAGFLLPVGEQTARTPATE